MVHGIRLGDLDVVDLARAHVFFQARHRVIGIHIDRVVHLHLENEVCAALEVEPEVNAIRN